MKGAEGSFSAASFVLEFTGRAGVGKSTVAHKLREHLGAESTEAVFLAKELGLNRLRAIDPCGFYKGSRLAFALKPRALHGWRNIPLCLSRLSKWRKVGGLLISDENLFQVISNLHVKELLTLEPAEVARYLARLPRNLLPDMVVNVDAAPEVLAARREKYRGAGCLEREIRLRQFASYSSDLVDLINDNQCSPPIRYFNVSSNSREETEEAISDLTTLLVDHN